MKEEPLQQLPPRPLRSLSPIREFLLEVAYTVLGPSKIRRLESQRAKLLVRVDRVHGSSLEDAIRRQREFEATDHSALIQITESLEAAIDMAHAKIGVVDRLRDWIERQLIPDPRNLQKMSDQALAESPEFTTR